MGRKLPYIGPNNFVGAHRSLALSLLAAIVAAVVTAVVAALCVSRHRKSSSKTQSPAQPSSPSSSLRSVAKTKGSIANESIRSTRGNHEQLELQLQHEGEENEERMLVLDVAHGPIEPAVVVPPVAPSGSRRRLSVNLSAKLPEGLARIRTKRQHEKEKGPLEESLLNKTIILGERCRVPSEDDEATVVDEKGNQQRIYHPRTPRSLPVSPRSGGNTSFANLEVPAGLMPDEESVPALDGGSS